MAVGDFITDLDNVNTTSLDFQPAAGVVVMCTMFSSSSGTSGAVQFQQYNGSINAMFVNGALFANGGTSASNPASMKVIIDNTNYLRRTTTSNQVCGYCGIQVAE